MLDYIAQQHKIWILILGVLTLVTLAEVFSARTGKQIPWKDRLFNIGVGSLYLIIGGYLGLLLFLSVDRLNVFRLASLDTVPYVVLFVLIQDLIYYFYHWLQHSWSLLWEIHKLHHTDPDVNITTSYRTHIVEAPVQTLLIFTPLVLFLGFHSSGTIYAYYLSMFFLYLSHSKLDLSLGPLSSVIVGPRFHRIHHSIGSEHLNKNFAQFFSFWDLLFGTYVKPEPIRHIRTGVPDCNTRREQYAPMVWPLSLLRIPRRPSMPDSS